MACFEECEGLKTADLLAILWTTFADVLGTFLILDREGHIMSKVNT